MATIHYLAGLDVIALNAIIMQEWQQESRLLNESALEGAVMRPQMAAYYERIDLAAQAAIFIEGIARAYAFLDGNKRTALAAGTIFLRINEYFIDSQETQFGQQIEALVMRTITLEDFTAWLRERMRPNP